MRKRLFDVNDVVDAGIAECMYRAKKVAAKADPRRGEEYVEEVRLLLLAEEFAGAHVLALSWADLCRWASCFSEREARADMYASGNIRRNVMEAVCHGIEARVCSRIRNLIVSDEYNDAPDLRMPQTPVGSNGLLWFGSFASPLVRVNAYAHAAVVLSEESLPDTYPWIAKMSVGGNMLAFYGESVESRLRPDAMDLVNAHRIKTMRLRKISGNATDPDSLAQLVRAGILELVATDYPEDRALFGLHGTE